MPDCPLFQKSLLKKSCSLDGCISCARDALHAGKYGNPVAVLNSCCSMHISEGFFMTLKCKSASCTIPFFQVTNSHINNLTAKLTGLTPESDYDFRVCAKNSTGKSPWSQTEKPITAMDAPGIDRFSGKNFVKLSKST